MISQETLFGVGELEIVLVEKDIPWILWYYTWRVLVISCPSTFIKIQFQLIKIWVNHPPGPYVLGYSPKVVSTYVAVLIYAYCKIISYHISFGQVSAFTILVWYQRFLGLSYQLVSFLSCWLQVLLHVSQHSNELKWIEFHKMTLGLLSSSSSMSF